MTLEDLQARVGAWHVETFGVTGMNSRMAAKLIEEAREVGQSVMRQEPPSCLGEELADCLIVLCAIAERNGIDLLAAAEAKFAVVSHPDRNQVERDNARGIS